MRPQQFESTSISAAVFWCGYKAPRPEKRYTYFRPGKWPYVMVYYSSVGSYRHKIDCRKKILKQPLTAFQGRIQEFCNKKLTLQNGFELVNSRSVWNWLEFGVWGMAWYWYSINGLEIKLKSIPNFKSASHKDTESKLVNSKFGIQFKVWLNLYTPHLPLLK